MKFASSAESSLSLVTFCTLSVGQTTSIVRSIGQLREKQRNRNFLPTFAISLSRLLLEWTTASCNAARSTIDYAHITMTSFRRCYLISFQYYLLDFNMPLEYRTQRKLNERHLFRNLLNFQCGYCFLLYKFRGLSSNYTYFP